MPDFNKEFYETEGPFGIPMKDRQAKCIDQLMRSHPQAEFKRLELFSNIVEKSENERSDVSWISKESIDRDLELVITKGVDLTQFQLNPIVTINHNYWNPPVGRSIWQKKLKDGNINGIKAKTVYPAKPAGRTEEWQPDKVFDLIRSDLMTGKSMGFIRLEWREPTSKELEQDPELSRVTTKSLLIEYSCCWIPVHPEAVITEVTKEAPSFITEEEISKAIEASFGRFDTDAMARKLLEQSKERISGRV